MEKKNYFTDNWSFISPPSVGSRTRLETFKRKCKKLEDEFQECGIDLISFDYDVCEFSTYLRIDINTKYRQLLEDQADDFYFFFDEHLPAHQTNEWEPVDWIREPIPEGYMGCHIEVHEPHLTLVISLDPLNRNVYLPTHDFMFLSSYPQMMRELVK